MNNEALQWLIDNRAEYLLLKVDNIFCLKITVEDPHGGKDHYTVFRLKDNSDFVQHSFAPAASALRKSVEDESGRER